MRIQGLGVHVRSAGCTARPVALVALLEGHLHGKQRKQGGIRRVCDVLQLRQLTRRMSHTLPLPSLHESHTASALAVFCALYLPLFMPSLSHCPQVR